MWKVALENATRFLMNYADMTVIKTHDDELGQRLIQCSFKKLFWIQNLMIRWAKKPRRNAWECEICLKIAA